MDFNIDEVLERAVSAGASDVHLKVGSAPIVRIDGFESFRPADTQGYAEGIFIAKAAADFKEGGTADFAYSRYEIARFRVLAFRQRGPVSMVLSRVVPGSKSFEELSLLRAMERVAGAQSGLILVTGPSGSEKTTTMSSMIDWINSNRGAANLTVEDPIEVPHPDKRSVVAQRELGVDTTDMAKAIRGAMRYDTDVIMISEFTDPVETINRLMSMYPESQKSVVRSQLASQVKATVSQLLVETAESGMVLAVEILTNNERTQEWTLDASEGSFLVEIIKESRFHGMQTFDQSLLKHVVDHTVEIDSALPFVRNAHEMRVKALSVGITI